jgi:hypothetical protein
VEIGVPVRVQTVAVGRPHAVGFESGLGFCHNTRFTWAVLSRAAADLDLERPVEARAPVAGGGCPGKGDGRGGSGGCSGGNGLGISGPMNFIFKTSNTPVGTGVPHV